MINQLWPALRFPEEPGKESTTAESRVDLPSLVNFERTGFVSEAAEWGVVRSNIVFGGAGKLSGNFGVDCRISIDPEVSKEY